MAGAQANHLAIQAPRPPFGPLSFAAMLSAIGALSVVVTSAFYVASPAAAAGPVQPLDLAAAMSAAVSGAPTLRAAGTVGVFGDLVWATAVLLLVQEFARRDRTLEAAGWIALFLSIVIFTLVDGMTGYVFPPLATEGDAGAFEGFKRLWDMLFQLGTVTYGVGVVTALAADRTSPRPMVGRVLAGVTMAVAAAGALGSLAGMAGVAAVPTDRVAGASIGLGSALLVAVSLQIALVTKPQES